MRAGTAALHGGEHNLQKAARKDANAVLVQLGAGFGRPEGGAGAGGGTGRACGEFEGACAGRLWRVGGRGDRGVRDG